MIKIKLLAAETLAILLMTSVSASLYAQLPNHLREYPLADRKANGDLVAPIFNGWTPNEDGSVTMLFGFANRNREEVVDIPLGPNNYIEPAQFDGAQPTHFPVGERPQLQLIFLSIFSGLGFAPKRMFSHAIPASSLEGYASDKILDHLSLWRCVS